jgi:hypothetical protein
MTQESGLISPIDPRYTGHRDAEERHRQTHEWLKQREREHGFVSDAPSTAPEKSEQS